MHWRPLLDDDRVSIWVAPVEVLLAMKLHALQIRPGRDADDVAKLLRLNAIDDVSPAGVHQASADRKLVIDALGSAASTSRFHAGWS